MALKMPSPARHANGVFHLNLRVPSDLAAKARGAPVTLPLDDAQVTVRPSDKVILSLRTRDPRLAKARFATAQHALALHWDALRRGPIPLTHKQLVALAGECYRASVERYEADPDFMPDGYLSALRQFEVDVAYWRHDGDDGFGDVGERDGIVIASLARPNGPQLLAYERGCDIDEFGVAVSYDDAVVHLFGAEADQLCRVRHIAVDPVTRLRLIREIAKAYRLLDRKLHRNAEGDYAPDENASRFPPFVTPAEAAASVASPSGAHASGTVGMAALFERWRAARAESLAGSTIRRYGPAIASLDAFTKGKDVRLITQDDIWDWAEHRTTQGATARTVNRNDLVAAASVLKWATTRPGKRLLADNPAKGVKLEEAKLRTKREKVFRAAEVQAILTLARNVAIDPKHPRTSASRRWAPWICAYSGARIQEVCHLGHENIRREGDVWVIDFPMTKDGNARTVPIHEHLVEEGLLAFWRSSPQGYLFVDAEAAKKDATRSIQEMRAGELASWIKAKAALEDGVSPNHGWRHTFATNAEAAGIPKRINTAITGHNKVKDASDGYITPSIGQLKDAMDKYPRYAL